MRKIPEQCDGQLLKLTLGWEGNEGLYYVKRPSSEDEDRITKNFS